MEIFFVVSLFLVVLVTINLTINISVLYDVYKNLGHIDVKVLGIVIYRADISLIAGYFNLVWNKKVVQIKIDINDENFKFIGDIIDYITKKVFFCSIDTNLQIYGTNPYKISLVAGNLILFEGIVRSYISYRSPDTTLNNNIDVGYIDNYIKMKVECGVLITIFDLMWAIIRASLRRGINAKGS